LKVLFIYSRQDSQSLAKPLQSPEQIQFGISYISSFLKKHGHHTKLLVLTRETKKNKIDECLSEFSPELICFTAVYTEYGFVANIANYIKCRYPHIFLLAGGVHVSLNPEDCISDCFDALCIGEGEYPILELTEQLQSNRLPRGIRNLWIKHGNEVERNSTRPFLQDIDNLPFPDRKMWQKWIAGQKECCSVLLGRGCPFRCTYCCNHALEKLAPGPYVRLRSVDNILKEIEEIVVDYPATKEIYLEIETITVNKSFVNELCSKLRHFNSSLKQPLRFGTNVRIVPNVDMKSIFAALKDSNFRYINIGIESGSERVRSQILKRNYSNEDIVEIANLARKYKLQMCFYNLIGIPGETMDDFRGTIKINRKCLPDRYFLSIFFPYPGTDLYSSAIEQGLIKLPLDVNMERNRAVLDLPGFSKKQIQKGYIWFDYYVYKGYKSLHKILARVFVSGIKTNYCLNSLYRNLTNYSIFRWLKNAFRGY